MRSMIFFAVSALALACAGTARADQITFSASRDLRTGSDPLDNNSPFGFISQSGGLRINIDPALGDTLLFDGKTLDQPLVLIGTKEQGISVFSASLTIGSGSAATSTSGSELVWNTTSETLSGDFVVQSVLLGAPVGTVLHFQASLTNVHTEPLIDNGEVSPVDIEVGDIAGTLSGFPTSPPPAVPEPTSLLLVSAGLALVARRRRAS